MKKKEYDKEQEKIRLENEKLKSELKAKKEAEIKAENERKEAEEKARKEAEKLAKAPVKKQLSVWVDSFEINRTYIDTNNATAKDIISKFEAFKNWAKKEIENL